MMPPAIRPRRVASSTALRAFGRRLLGHRAARLPDHDQRRDRLATTGATLPLG